MKEGDQETEGMRERREEGLGETDKDMGEVVFMFLE